MPEPAPYTLRPVEVAKRLSVSRRTVYNLLTTRQLGYIMAGGQETPDAP